MGAMLRYYSWEIESEEGNSIEAGAVAYSESEARGRICQEIAEVFPHLSTEDNMALLDNGCDYSAFARGLAFVFDGRGV